MRILILSLDRTILDQTSEAFRRMQEYAGLVESLHVFVFTNTPSDSPPFQGGERGGLDLRADQKLLLYSFEASVLGWIRALLAGRKLVKEKQIDVVSVQEPFEIGLLGFLISKFSQSHGTNHGTVKGAGLNVQLHGDFYGNPYWRGERLFNRLRWHFGLFVLHRANSIRVVSERIKQSLISNLRFQILDLKIIKVPIYTDIEYFRNAQPIFSLKQKYPQFNFIILTVANLVPVKNLEFLIRAMKKLHEILPQAGLIIVGDGPLKKKLNAKRYTLNASDYIIFEGAQKDLVPYYKGADCFVLVSKYEGWGRAVVEVAASGLPIVMTDVGLAGEIIKNEETGLIFCSTFRFDQKAEEEFVRALSQIYFNQNLRAKLTSGAEAALQNLPTKQATLEAIKQSWEMAQQHQ